MHKLYLSLGSNLGHRKRMISQAIRLIDERIGRVYRVSSMMESEPWGFESENKFMNACCLVHTMMEPRRCLEETQRIERELGRAEKSADGQYRDRSIDIDLLMFDDLRIDEPNLKIPHPLMHEREFVMQPLKEIIDN